jgi:hypothetical protein
MRGVGSRGLAAGSQAGSSYRLDPDPTYHHSSIPQRKVSNSNSVSYNFKLSHAWKACWDLEWLQIMTDGLSIK